MRTINRLVLTCCLGLAVFGCTNRRGGYEGPTVDAFHGKVTHNGNPVKFAEQEAQLALYHESGQQFGIPLKNRRIVRNRLDAHWQVCGHA